MNFHLQLSNFVTSSFIVDGGFIPHFPHVSIVKIDGHFCRESPLNGM